MKTIQQGFTLIELIVVIVILGILAATALPKFVDLSSDAEAAAVAGVAGALSSASTINYGATKLNKSPVAAIASCDDVTTNIALLLQGPLPDGYSISTGGTCSNGAVTCSVSNANGVTRSATIVCAP